MRMLGRLALGCFDGLSRFRCRRSLGLRLIHLAPRCGVTETLAHPAVSPPAADPRWVMLNTDLCLRDTVADAKTAAECRTTRGRSLHISVDLATPPVSSFICYDNGDDFDIDPEPLIAAHGDSVLLGFERSSGNTNPTFEYYVYGAAAGGRPPSLSLLPTHNYTERFHGPEYRLREKTTGLLRRGDGELLVVELRVRRSRNVSSAPLDTADINVLRLGSFEWDTTRTAVPIVHSDGSRGHELEQWALPDRVVSVGDRFLCWVKYSRGFLLYDMADDPNFLLRYLPLPVAAEDDHYGMQYCKNMCGVGAEALRFVSIDSRSCTGGSGLAFTVTTWTMSLRMGEEMAWVVDGVLDCKELWDLPGCRGLPCVPPSCPVVSPCNPDVICFRVSDRCLLSSFHDQAKVWMLEVDTRRKVLLSVVQCHEESYEDHLPVKFY